MTLNQYILVATVAPGGVYEAPQGTIALDLANGFLWVKVSGSGSTGWELLISDAAGVAQLTQGGTGATTAAGARSNLSVYSKAEVDALLAAKATAGAATSGPSAGTAHTHSQT